MPALGPPYALGIIGGGIAVQMALPSLLRYGRIAIHYRSDTSQTYPEFDFIDSLEQMFDPELVNALFIATPVDTHVEMLLRADKAKIPTLLEKPLARSLDEGQRLEVRSAGRRTLAFRKRFSDLATAITSTTRAHPSDPCLANFQWLAPNPGPDHWKLSNRASGGGVVLDIASHVLDLIEFSISPISRIKITDYVLDSVSGSDKYVEFVLELDDDSRVTAQIGWADANPMQCLTLTRSKNRLLWLKNAYSSGSILYETTGNEVRATDCRRLDEYDRMFAAFRNYAETGELSKLPTWKQAVRNLYLMNTMFEQLEPGNLE